MRQMKEAGGKYRAGQVHSLLATLQLTSVQLVGHWLGGELTHYNICVNDTM